MATIGAIVSFVFKDGKYTDEKISLLISDFGNLNRSTNFISLLCYIYLKNAPFELQQKWKISF